MSARTRDSLSPRRGDGRGEGAVGEGPRQSNRRLGVALLLCTACGFNFDSPSEVKDLRVLGLKSDPPELTATAPVTLVQLDALIGGADPSTQADYEWTACAVAPSQGSFFGSTATRCPEDAGTTFPIAKGRARLDSLQAVMPVPREIITVLASGVEGLSLQLQAQLKVNDLYAVKRITVTPTLPGMQAPNSNPAVTDLTLDGAAWDAGTITFDSCTDDKRGTEVGQGGMMVRGTCRRELDPLTDPSAHQKFFAEGLSGAVEEETERFSYSWFVDQGTLEQGVTQEPDPDFDIGQRIKVSTFWREPKEKPSGAVTFWVVVRDGRGGENWSSRQLVFP